MKNRHQKSSADTAIHYYHKEAIALLLTMQQEALAAESPDNLVWREDWKARLGFEQQLSDELCEQIEASLIASQLVSIVAGENIFVVAEAQAGVA
ncbi:hypothetical protein QSV37_15210 [Acinetobacter sp. VNK23]|uniref:hypothetical protein n=1 Tax=Acinetobacter thutiue TaxID=2998078 RepID=UPI002576BB5A|nr:hypothetical protein [Acinetobacter thutiue]MDM1021641.1 hypothetical protein [Acinetobacter thutiue]